MRTEADDREMMDKPNRWPRRPVLPLKNYPEVGKTPLLGVLVEGRGPVVYAASPSTPVGTILAPTTPSLGYPSLDILVADGWRVD
jgi:hypothetical protein